MNWKTFVFAATLVAFAAIGTSQDLQLRAVVHPTFDLTPDWFIASWQIGNARSETPDNANIFVGAGYRGKKWSQEVLLQRQWTHAGNHWALSGRFQAQVGSRGSLYVEVTPFLTRSAVYNLMMFDYRVLPKVTMGLEADNTFRPGRDQLGIGPRIGYLVWSNKTTKIGTALVYHLRPDEADSVRLYVSVHHRF